ncbi:MAG: hypothetical protein H7315_14220 [Herminiimonas sp.]|nr:hypothetical protein [Herminiimonas sp.]
MQELSTREIDLVSGGRISLGRALNLWDAAQLVSQGVQYVYGLNQGGTANGVDAMGNSW